MTVSGQPENQAGGTDGVRAAGGSREQAMHVAVSAGRHTSLHGHHLGFPCSGASQWLTARHPLVTLIDSSIRISGQEEWALQG